MRKQFNVAVLVIVFLSSICFGAEDLQFEGKSMDGWINLFFGMPEKSGDPNPTKEMEQQAVDAFQRMSSRELDYIVEQLQPTNESKIPPENIEMILRIVGSNAIPEIPNLIKLLDQNQPTAQIVAECLDNIGTNAVPSLMLALSDKSAKVRQNAVYAIGGIKPHAKEAVPLLLDLAQKDEPAVRNSAIMSLGMIGEYPSKVVPVLVKNLNNNDPNIRANSAAGIVRFCNAPEAKEAVPALFKLLHDDNKTVRNNAVNALIRMNLEKSYIPLLASNATNSDFKVRSFVAEALGKQTASTNEVIPFLLQLTKDPDQYVRYSAVATLKQMGYKSP